MATFANSPDLPSDLEAVFSAHQGDRIAHIKAFMPVFCDHVKADRIFIQPRNPHTKVCMVLRWRRNENVPWPTIPGQPTEEKWFIEDNWEDEDPMWAAALKLKPSIYIEDLEKAAAERILNLDFENSYFFHTAFIHGHAHWPPLPAPGFGMDDKAGGRQFYGSVQPAVFDGPRVWPQELRKLVEKCLVRIAPIMKSLGETAPSRESFKEDKEVLIQRMLGS